MGKRKRLRGRERREIRRRQLQPLTRRRSLALWAAAAGVTAVVVVVAVFALRSGGGSSAVANPTPLAGATVSVSTPQGSAPPPVSGEPRFTSSGLGIIDVSEGSGATPKAGQTIVVEFTGWLSDGRQFASSENRGSPFEFVLGAGKVIAGWDEGLATMKVGGKRRLIIPASLAYGERGRSPNIPPNSELTYDLEMLEIK